MHVLLLGSGGREHALAWKLAQSPRLRRLFIAPGNPGTAGLGTNVALDTEQPAAVVAFCQQEQIDMVVIGPEAPLVAGVADALRAAGIATIGPNRLGAQLEGSKAFSKDFMRRHSIPTAAYGTFTTAQMEDAVAFLHTQQPPFVIKASGLAAGKGVVIVNDVAEAERTLREMLGGALMGAAGQTVVIEQYLPGIEVSVFVLTDGKDYVLLPEAKDYKRIGEGDNGPNTGGMGAVSPVPFFTPELREKTKERLIKPTLQGLQADGIPFLGFLFLGLMVVDGEPYLLEYNVRLGDPECQTILPRLENDLLELFLATTVGTLGNHAVRISDSDSATVVCVSPGYPGAYPKGLAIAVGDETEHLHFFHAGTTLQDGKLVTAGGRVVAVNAVAADLETAISHATQAAAQSVAFDGRYFRKDIGQDVLALRDGLSF